MAREFNSESVIKTNITNIHQVEFCRSKLILHPDGTPTMMTDPKRIEKIYGMRYKPMGKGNYVDYLRAVHHCNFSINRNTPAKFLWQPLDVQIPGISTEQIFNFVKKNMDDQALSRVKIKEKTNKPWAEPILTQSVLEAYPEFSIRRPYPIQSVIPAQISLCVNHSNKTINLL